MNEDEESIKTQIERLIPSKLSLFPKLVSGEPYVFDKWSYDREGRHCLYYRVTGGIMEHKKRVPMQELIRAVTSFRNTGRFTRTDFQKLCPVANRDGPCGYAVALRISEFLAEASAKEKTI